MARRSALVFAFVLVAVALPAGSSLAGGFCSYHSNGGMVGFTDEASDTVVMKDNCFVSTVVRIQPGDTVTWINKDSTDHAVGGVANSFGDLHKMLSAGDRYSNTFEDEGVYPYLCILHPGMGGAVVVGDGLGDLSAATTTSTEDGGAAAVAPTRAQASDDGHSVPMLLALGIAVVLLTAATVGLARRSRQGSEAPQQI